MPRWGAWAVATGLVAALAGCGDGSNIRSATFYPVKGKVTLPDGKPLGGVRVLFSGPAITNATTESDGTFTVKGDKDGLPAGDYAVRLEILELKGTAKKPELPFPKKYLDEDTSDLKAKVTPEGPNDFDFKLTKGDTVDRDEAPRGQRSGQGARLNALS